MISYFEPLKRAWIRMRGILFSPFDLGKWFALGFTAWLAELANGSRSGGANFRGKPDFWDGDWRDAAISSTDSVRDFIQGGLEIFIVVFLVLAAILIAVVLLWFSSRGTFMFLDNVVHNRSRVTDPWRRYSRLGNSLFLWRLAYMFGTMILIGALVVIAVLMALPLMGDGVLQGVGILGLVLVVLLAIILGFVAAFISMLVDQFVVPLMYKHDLAVLAAWRLFLPLLRQRFLTFVFFGLLYFVAQVVFAICALVFGLVTCCVGFLLLAIPYIGTILWLPIHVTFRGFGLEFLSQFGPDWSLRDLFPENRPPSTVTEGPTG